MSRKSHVEITADLVRKAIEDGKLSSLTGLAHSLGYKGSVSSSLTKRFRGLLPDIDALMAAYKPTKGGEAEVGAGKAKKPKATKPQSGKAKLPPRHPQNPFRKGSTYGVCFDLLAQANPDGLQREKLVELLAVATGKSAKLAAYDAQVCLSARGAAGPDLNPFEGPRNRSCRFGFWVKRENSHVKLVLPATSTVSKEMP